MDELTAELAAAAWFESARVPVMSASELTGEHQFGPGSVILTTVLSGVVRRLNPDLPHDTIEEVVRILSRPPHPTLVRSNRWLHALVTDGVEIEYQELNGGETRGGRARLVDFDNPAANDLLVLRQISVAGASGNVIRPDLTVFLNGLPVALIELKDPTDTQADLSVAIDQLDRYMRTVPDLFVSNLVLVVSDGVLTRVGSITSGRGRFMPWRPIDGREGGGAPTLEALIRGLFDLRTLVGLPADLCHLRRGRAGRDRQEDRGLPPVPRGAQGALQRACASQVALWHRRRSRWRDLAHTGFGQVADHAHVGRRADSRVAHGQPDDRHDHRPQRSGRSALRHLRRRTRAAAAGPGPGREPGASRGPARPRGGRGGVHDDSEVHRGARRSLGALERGRDGRRGPPQPVRLRRGRRALDARGAAERPLSSASPARRWSATTETQFTSSAITRTSTTSAGPSRTAPPGRSTTNPASSS